MKMPLCTFLTALRLCVRLVYVGVGGVSTHAYGPDHPALGKGGALEFVFFLLWTRGVSNDFYTPDHIASSSSERIQKSVVVFVQYYDHNHVVVRKIEREHQNHDE